MRFGFLSFVGLSIQLNALLQRKFLDVLHKRRYELNASTTSSTQDILHSWKLRHIEIRTHKGTGDNLMQAAANAVPFLSPVEGPKLPIFRLKK